MAGFNENTRVKDQSQKSTTMLRLNLILNNLVSSLPNVIQGDSLTDWGHERKDGTFDKMYDYVVSNILHPSSI